jgi:hypothetical protein
LKKLAACFYFGSRELFETAGLISAATDVGIFGNCSTPQRQRRHQFCFSSFRFSFNHIADPRTQDMYLRASAIHLTLC